MSLINEALKKAQRQRNDGPVEPAAPAPTGGARIAKRAPTRSANSMILLASGAVVLVVVSVALTFFLVNRPKPQTPAAVVAVNPPPPKSEEKPMSPIVLPPPAAAPVIQTPIATLPPATTPPAAAPVEPVAAPRTVAVEPKPVAPPAKPAVPVIDERVHAFVDGLRVTGARAAGADSRVLMNDRFFRINEIVDRTLGVRLIKVESDKLTFADANDVTYVKFY